MLFFTDDSGIYLTNTRDVTPTSIREFVNADDEQRIMALCNEHTTQLSDQRLDLPAGSPHMLAPNFWMGNAPGSTLFMTVGDASEQLLGFLAMAIANGTLIVDDGPVAPPATLRHSSAAVCWTIPSLRPCRCWN